jgi:FtsH-binding integral membrane protein
MSGSYGKMKNDYIDDIETGNAGLYPGISAEDNVLRWAFIRKVYGILSTQMVLTTAVAAVIVFSIPVRDFFASSPGLLLAIAFLPLVCEFSDPQILRFCSLLILFLGGVLFSRHCLSFWGNPAKFPCCVSWTLVVKFITL